MDGSLSELMTHVIDFVAIHYVTVLISLGGLVLGVLLQNVGARTSRPKDELP